MQRTLQTIVSNGPRRLKCAAACFSDRTSLHPPSWQAATLFCAENATQAVLGLTDGEGSWGLGYEASELAARQLQETLLSTPSGYDTDGLASAAAAAGESAWSKLSDDEVCDTAFSLGLVFVDSGDMRFAWVGSPLCMLMREERLLYRSAPHLIGEEDHRRGTPHDVVYAHRHAYVYTRAMGSDPQLHGKVQLEWSPPLGPVQAGDQLLVLSVGLWRAVTLSKLTELLSSARGSARDVEQVVQALIGAARSQGAVGDVAAIALAID